MARALSISASPAGLGRTAFWMVLCLGEIALISYLFEIRATIAPLHNPVFYATTTVRIVMLSAPLIAFCLWPRRDALLRQWTAWQSAHKLYPALLVNMAVFAATCALAIAISLETERRGEPAWDLVPAMLVMVLATGISLLRIDIPLRGLAALAWPERRLIAGSLAMSFAILIGGANVTPLAWDLLAGTTLNVAAWLVRIVNPDVVVDTADRVIAIGQFAVRVDLSCSGYEGLALVAGFITIYLWAFRKELRFPAAYVLYPMGLTAIWLLNSLRIAALTVLGAYVSPDVAVKGFHSQAGWISFLLVSVGLMVISRQLGFLARSDRGAGRIQDATDKPSVDAYLVPFIALMLGSIAMATLAPFDRPAYVIKAGLAAAALWFYARHVSLRDVKLSPLALAAGALVGIAWILTDPGAKAGETQTLGAWLETLAPGVALLWLIVRGFGTIVLVPIAEELAFRGYLYRRIIAHDFQNVPATQLSLAAMVASSLLFGALHERWMAAGLSGAVFALVMLRRGRLQDAVTAHAAANALIFAWALAARQWSLL